MKKIMLLASKIESVPFLTVAIDGWENCLSVVEFARATKSEVTTYKVLALK